MSEKRHLSHTQLDMLSKCGQAWKFRYVDGIKRPPPSVKMLIGRGVDHSVTANLRHKRDEGSDIDLEDAQDRARDGLNYEWAQEGVTLEPDEEEAGLRRVRGAAVDATVALAGAHHQEVAPKIRPAHVQRRFEIALEGYDCTLVGVIDVQEERGRITTDNAELGTAAPLESAEVIVTLVPSRVSDTKTTRKSLNQNDVDTSSQLTTYSMAVEVIDGSPPDEVGLDILIDKSQLKTPKAPVTKRLTSSRDEEDTRALLARVERAVTVIDSGIVTPAPPGAWWCSEKWCGYWKICPFVNSARVALGERK